MELDALLDIIEEMNSTFEFDEEGIKIVKPNIPHLLNNNNSQTSQSQALTNFLDISQFFHIIDAYRMPQYQYDPVYKCFTR